MENPTFDDVSRAGAPLEHIVDLPPVHRAKGVVTASRGEHGRGVAWAARLAGVDATVVVPSDADPESVAAIRYLGAMVVEHGADFEAASAAAWELSLERCATYICCSEEPRRR